MSPRSCATAAVYNEDLVIEALTDYGYSLSEARKFANDGCWEVQIPGKTFFNYLPFDSLCILQQHTLNGYEPPVEYHDFESLYSKYITDLKAELERIFDNISKRFSHIDAESQSYKWHQNTPCTIVSLFEGGCVEKGVSYLEGGPVYNVMSPHIGGLADTANSLYAIKKIVFDEKKLTLSEFLTVLKNNWEDNETLRHQIKTKYKYYGNDNNEVDLIAARILNDFAEICAALDGRLGYNFPASVSTFGRQLGWVSQRLASPHGRKLGEVLAGNCSPTPGTDREGATAIIRSYCKADLKKQVTGAALDIRLLPSNIKGDEGISALVSLMRGFVTLGGYFMQLDIADAEILRQAQEHPEDYRTLSVRVSGWNARFVTMNKDWQDMVIAQNE